MDAHLTELIAKARAQVDAMSPTEHRAMLDAQCRSWAKAEFVHGDDDNPTPPEKLAEMAELFELIMKEQGK